MIQYATIEEAWSTSAPPVRYTPGASFNVGRHDGETFDSNFCQPGGVALESAYPPSGGGEDYERMYGSRSMDTLQSHSPRDAGCTGFPESNGSDPEQMYAHGSGSGDAVGSQYDIHHGGNHGGNHGNDVGATSQHAKYGHPAKHAPARPSGHVRHAEAPKNVYQHSPEVTERGRLYDILVFILFGLLIVLAMHEIAALGEVIGRNRAGAVNATRRAFSYNHRPARF